MSDIAEPERTALRSRPRGWPVMHQTWDELLFLHWPMDPCLLRPLIPAGLEIDTWDGSAWIGITPFTIYGMRPPLVPPVPLISTSHELNVRTYVHRDRIPGVWFLSLDASNRLAVWGARIGFFLPYFHAAIRLKSDAKDVDYRSVRTRRSTPANFHARWRWGPRIPDAEPGTRDFFLIERYCLYSSRGGRLYRARIHHRPWPLRGADVLSLSSSMLSCQGLPDPIEPPLVHAQAERLHVYVWAPTKVC